MKFICDFEIHSKYSRACSKHISIKELAKWANIKGIKLLGTGDFTHPLWLEEIEKTLEPAEPGFYILKKEFEKEIQKESPIEFKKEDVRFFLTGEVNCIYHKKAKLRKVHIGIFVPNIETAKKINKELSWFGNLASDGRPTLKLDAKELLKIVLSIDPRVLIIPYHVWTPWFGIFGSKSGFDSLEECFDEMEKYVYAVETGLSSDPEMNFIIPWLKNKAVISSSDAHSCPKIGREATCFNTEFNYRGIYEAIKENSNKKIAFTIEFYPEEGKYHYDGHRNCDISLSPEESKKYNFMCPVCKNPLTLGVLHRVEKLSKGYSAKDLDKRPPFYKIVPLEETISEVYSLRENSLALRKKYFEVISNLGKEFEILLKIPIEEIKKFNDKLAKAIEKIRNNDIFVKPGYDGVFGEVKIFSKGEVKERSLSQDTLL